MKAVLRIAVEWGVVDLFSTLLFSARDPGSLGRNHHGDTGATDISNHPSDFVVFIIPTRPFANVL